MSYKDRLRQFYNYRVDLYKPVLTATGKVGGEMGYPATPTYANVAAAIDPTPNVNMPRTLGSTKETNIFTDDKIHLADTQEIGTGWLVHMVGDISRSDNPLIGGWWIVQGIPQRKSCHALKHTCYIVPTPKPVGVL